MSAPKPNILWIVTTQWRAQACGYAGDPNASTPWLDELAAQSVNHAQAVTPHPFGPFARAALLTGVPSPANGVCDYHDPLPAGARTIAHDLRERGYATAFLGKWHLGRRNPADPLVGDVQARVILPPDARGGFEFWEGFEGGFLLNDPWLQGTGIGRPRKFPGYQSEVLCTRAAEWIAGRGSHPARGSTQSWFAVVSLEPPHPPYEAPSAGVTPRPPDNIVLPASVPRGGAVETQARRELAGYYAHIGATDRAIGTILLPAVTNREDTIVVFTSVHGDMHGAHGLFRKGWPHEESVRVPLLIRQPGTDPRRDDTAVSLLDLPGMTRAWADGRATGARRTGSLISMPSVVALPQQCDRVWRGVRTRTHKLVLNAGGSPWLYFDLEHDPLEMKNLAGDPARTGEIAELLPLLQQ